MSHAPSRIPSNRYPHLPNHGELPLAAAPAARAPALELSLSMLRASRLSRHAWKDDTSAQTGPEGPYSRCDPAPLETSYVVSCHYCCLAIPDASIVLYSLSCPIIMEAGHHAFGADMGWLGKLPLLSASKRTAI